MSDCEAASMRPAYALVLAFTCMTMSGLVKASNSLKSVDYEVFGRVQGVCFRMMVPESIRLKLPCSTEKITIADDCWDIYYYAS
ncbi:hypothetical protein GDO81_008580 [Engystomops pustulosus]|uniref:Acylphosphatase n=1 Tax=Engystomops pustulosus TaxID=76066 RepID=A0AAV7CFV5_ENGPU|nr:hypothetical protein GDO81_008580 [Engystomops pustulosus]